MFTSRHVCVINGGQALTDKNEVEGAYQNLPKLLIQQVVLKVRVDKKPCHMCMFTSYLGILLNSGQHRNLLAKKHYKFVNF